MQDEMFCSFLSSPICARSTCQNKEWVCQVGPLIRRPHTFFLEMLGARLGPALGGLTLKGGCRSSRNGFA